MYQGRVVNITKFGAFVNILPGRDGLLHISKLGRGKRVEKVEDVVDLGDEVAVRVDDIDPQGKVSLSLLGDDSEASEPAYAAAPSAPRPPRPVTAGNGASEAPSAAAASPAPAGDVVSFEDTWEEEAKASSATWARPMRPPPAERPDRIAAPAATPAVAGRRVFDRRHHPVGLRYHRRHRAHA